MLYEIRDLLKTRQREKGYKLWIRRLSLEAGAKIALLGPSGCGKSTALDILGLSLAPNEAKIFKLTPPGGVTILPLFLWGAHQYDALADIRLQYLGLVLQSGELLPYLTVGENICMTAALLGLPKKEIVDFGHQLAQRLQIADLWDALPHTLSVGERQRAAICRALAPRPPVIIADEPTAALDPWSAERVMGIFLECTADFGSTLILATHNASWAASGGLREVRFILEKDEGGQTVAVIDDGVDIDSSAGGTA